MKINLKVMKLYQNPFILNIDKRKLYKNGIEIELTPTEFSIVKYLMVNAKKSLSRESNIK